MLLINGDRHLGYMRVVTQFVTAKPLCRLCELSYNYHMYTQAHTHTKFTCMHKNTQ